MAKISNSTFDKNVGAGDRLNIAFSSSTISKGRAKGVIISTVSHLRIDMRLCPLILT